MFVPVPHQVQNYCAALTFKAYPLSVQPLSFPNPAGSTVNKTCPTHCVNISRSSSQTSRNLAAYTTVPGRYIYPERNSHVQQRSSVWGRPLLQRSYKQCSSSDDQRSSCRGGHKELERSEDPLSACWEDLHIHTLTYPLIIGHLP